MTSLSMEQAAYVQPLDECIVCGERDLELLVDLGDHYLTDFLDVPDPDHPKAPLKLYSCPSCDLFQLGHVVSRDRLFRQYWYKSGINDTMRQHLGQLASELTSDLALKKGDIVVDIGSNDGTFLRQFPKAVTRVGFDPAENLRGEAEVGGNTIIADYFLGETFWGAKKAKVVTSLAMFYDLLEPEEFVQDVRAILDPKGVWVVEMNYPRHMIERGAFDIMGHEHVAVYFISTFNRLIRPLGMEVHKVQMNDLNGGSVRLYVGHKGARTTDVTVDRALFEEAPLRNRMIYKVFAARVRRIRGVLTDWTHQAVAAGAVIHAYGASTRGMTTIQASNLPLSAAWDRNPAKVGKLMAGVNVPVISEQEGRQTAPDYLFVLPWAFIDEFRTREEAYLASGGKMIVPLPEPQVLTA